MGIGQVGPANQSTGGNGNVTGPNSAVSGHLAVFSGTTGKIIADGGAVPTPISGLTPNTLTKGNGTGDGVVNSQITDDGTTVKLPDLIQIGAPLSLSAEVTIYPGSNAFTYLFDDIGSTAMLTKLLDNTPVFEIQGNGHLGWFEPNGGENIVITRTAANTLGITAPVQTNTASTSISEVTPLFGTGTTGVEFQNSGAGLTTKYNNIATAGNGLSAIYGSVSLTAQAASIGATNIQVGGAVAPSGLYKLTYYLWITTAGTSGTVSGTFGWSDTAAARTSSTGNATFGSLAAPLSGSIVIQANGVAQITYLTTVTAAVGSPQYALRITLERLQ